MQIRKKKAKLKSSDIFRHTCLSFAVVLGGSAACSGISLIGSERLRSVSPSALDKGSLNSKPLLECSPNYLKY